jgi:hypothetical protein
MTREQSTAAAPAPESMRESPSNSAGSPRGRIARTNDLLFRTSFIATIAIVGAISLIPIIQTLRAGQFFGGDWGEYLYTGPAYLHGTQGLYLYPYPVLPISDIGLVTVFGARTVAVGAATEVVSGLLILAVFGAAYFAISTHVRGRWAGLVGAVVLASFPLYLYEVAWGGQAQLLAYVFGLIALGVILRNGIPGRSLHLTVFAGLALALSAATEIYAASFILASVALLFLVFLAFYPSRWRTLVSMVATLVLPIIIGGVILVSNPSFTHPAGEPSLWRYWNYAPLWSHLWRSLTFQNAILAEMDVVILLGYTAFRIVFRARDPFQLWLVPVLGIAALSVGFLLTPAPVADRSLYPFGFPLGFAVAELASGWPSAQRNPTPRKLWALRREEVTWTLPVLVIASVTVAGLQLGSDVQLYPGSIAGYSFDQSELSELTWLAGEPGGIVYDSPNTHVFPVQWATDRPMFPGPAYQPYFLSSAGKQASAILATSLSFGPRWFDDGNLIVTDTEPEWGQPAPGILMFQDAHLYETLEGNDFLDLVSYSPNADPTATSSSALFYAQSVATSQSTTTTSVYYNWTDLSAVRTVQVLPSGPILLNYSFDFSASIPRSVSLYLTSPGKTTTTGSILDSGPRCSNASISQQYPASWIPPIPISFGVGACTTGATATARYVPSDQYGIFELEYKLTPENPTVRNLSLSIAIRPSLAGSTDPSLVREASALATNQIEWIVLDKSSNQILLQRFMDDPLYSLYRSTTDYLVLSTG